MVAAASGGPARVVVLGANGQLGRALRARWAERNDVASLGRDQADLERPESLGSIDWTGCEAIVNAAAYTAVDAAETPEGRIAAWQVNAVAPAALARIAADQGIGLVHVSSDYVFDGTRPEHREDEPFSPLGVYGQSKAAGDIAVATAPRHWIVRTSWVVGEGRNFVATMASLAERGIDPTVVGDQVGRLTFAAELARAIDHLLAVDAPAGTYNVSNAGEPRSWAEIAQRVFERTGHDPARVTPVTTAAYFAGKDGIAPRPEQSAMDLSRLRATGFEPEDHEAALDAYVDALSAGGPPQDAAAVR